MCAHQQEATEEAAVVDGGNELEASLCTFLPLSPLISNVKTPDKMVDRSSQS